MNKNDWNDWHWQLKNRICKLSDLEKIITLTEDEKMYFHNTNTNKFPFAITPYIASKIDRDNLYDPIRKQLIPHISELIISKGNNDYLKESEYEVAPNLIRRYHNRAIYISTTQCASYCRYCTRKRVVGDNLYTTSVSNSVIKYLNQHNEINEIILTGGDPLILEDNEIKYLLHTFSNIKSIKTIRIGTRVPVTMPMRITDNLVSIFSKFNNLYINIHFSHKCELTDECKEACLKLANSGIPLGSQTVLLSGINDSSQQLEELFNELISIKVKPYYLFQCDKIKGCENFIVPIEKGVEIINVLQKRISGMAVPRYVIDYPGNESKLSIAPCCDNRLNIVNLYDKL